MLLFAKRRAFCWTKGLGARVSAARLAQVALARLPQEVYGQVGLGSARVCLTTRCISYSNGRFGHLDQNRAISIREAACLQTFPRKYRFAGSHESKARQVGNAVPPLMAKAIGKAFLAHAREPGRRRSPAV